MCKDQSLIITLKKKKEEEEEDDIVINLVLLANYGIHTRSA